MRRMFPPVCSMSWITLAWLCSTFLASAKIIYVNRSAAGSNNGTSWANAYTALQPAIASALSGDQVWIATGTYRPNDSNPSNLSRSQSFALKSGVAVYGGFAGTESMLSARNPTLYPVTLSGDLLGNDSAAGTLGVSSISTTADNVLRVFSHSSVAATAVLDSVIIRGGNADGTNNMTTGGGMYNSFSNPSITNCLFVDNRASLGGGSANSLSSPVFTGCTFCFNTATSQGGAIYNHNSQSVKLVNCTLANNTAITGGAIMNSTSTLIAIHTTVAYNSSAVVTSGNPSGSGIRSILSTIKDQQSTLFLHNCILWGNLNSVQLHGGNTTASNCIIQGGFTGPLQGVETYSLTDIRNIDPLISNLSSITTFPPVIAPAAESPAINSGITTLPSPLSIPAMDQRGTLRDPQPDIGTIEHPVHVPSGPSPQQVVIGASANLAAATNLASPSYQWYRGRSGDTSSPLAGLTSPTCTTPPLGIGTDFWVAVTSGGQTIASPTVSVQVRGTYPQWVAFYQLLGPNALPEASPARDGLSNLLKFATGLAPSIPATQASCLMTSSDASTGLFHLDLTLSRTPTDVTWEILEFTPPSGWSPTAQPTSPTTSSTSHQTHRLTLPANSPTKLLRARFVNAP